MNYLLEYLPTRYLQDIADYFASQHPPLPAPESTERQPACAGAGEVARHQRRRRRGRSRPAELPWAEPHGHGARNSGPARAAADLYQRAARRMALRHADGAAPDCMQGVAARLTEADVTAVAAYLATPTRACGHRARAERHFVPALRLRQRTRLRCAHAFETSAHGCSRFCVASRCFAGRAASAQDKQRCRRRRIVRRGEYLARAGDCVACHTAPEGRLFAGGLAMPTPFGTLYTSNITPDPRPASANGARTSSTGPCTTAAFRDGGLIYPAMPFASYTKVTRADSDAIFAYLQIGPAGAQGEPAERSALPLQQPLADSRLAHAVLHRGRVQARPDQVRGMESRRLSGRGARPLRDVPHARSTRSAAARNRRPSRAA